MGSNASSSPHNTSTGTRMLHSAGVSSVVRLVFRAEAQRINDRFPTSVAYGANSPSTRSPGGGCENPRPSIARKSRSTARAESRRSIAGAPSWCIGSIGQLS